MDQKTSLKMKFKTSLNTSVHLKYELRLKTKIHKWTKRKESKSELRTLKIQSK